MITISKKHRKKIENDPFFKECVHKKRKNHICSGSTFKKQNKMVDILIPTIHNVNNYFHENIMIKKCKHCKQEFKSQPCQNRKFCSKKCHSAYCTKKATIKCKHCGKEFHRRHSLIKFCSVDCSSKASRVKRKCIICGEIFEPAVNGEKKTCSNKCMNEAMKNKNKGKRVVEYKKTKCKECGKIFERVPSYSRSSVKFCSIQCVGKYNKKKRINKGNPNYRGGYFTKKNFVGKIARSHRSACARYRKHFLKKHNYLFCEICGVNSNGTIKHDTHHIYYASRFPKHKNLHNFKNLIMLCRECHLKFHNSKEYHDKFIEIEKERGLKELFS